MKECDILGGENILRPSYIFSGGQDPNPQDLRPWVVGKVASENAETKKMKKYSERRKHCASAGCSTVRTPPARPAARCHKSTDRTDYNTPRRS